MFETERGAQPRLGGEGDRGLTPEPPLRAGDSPDLGACWPAGEARWLLQIACAPAPVARRAWQEWTASLGGRAPDLGSVRLLPLITRRLLELGVSASSSGRLKGVYRHTWCNNQLRVRKTQPALEALAQAGVRTLALKGLALLASAYGADLGLRAMLDSDVLVRREDLALAAQTLVASGWRARHAPTQAALCQGHTPWGEHAFPLLRDGVELDLHWHCSRLDPSPWLDDLAWQGAERLTLCGLQLEAPRATEMLLLVCVHGVYWTRGRTLHWPSDAYRLVSSGAVDWERFVTVAAERLLTLPVYDALRFVAHVLSAPVPDAVLRRLAARTVSPPEQAEYRALTQGIRARFFDRVRAAQLAAFRGQRRESLRQHFPGLEAS